MKNFTSAVNDLKRARWEFPPERVTIGFFIDLCPLLGVYEAFFKRNLRPLNSGAFNKNAITRSRRKGKRR